MISRLVEVKMGNCMFSIEEGSLWFSTVSNMVNEQVDSIKRLVTYSESVIVG